MAKEPLEELRTRIEHEARTKLEAVELTYQLAKQAIRTDYHEKLKAIKTLRNTSLGSDGHDPVPSAEEPPHNVEPADGAGQAPTRAEVYQRLEQRSQELKTGEPPENKRARIAAALEEPEPTDEFDHEGSPYDEEEMNEAIEAMAERGIKMDVAVIRGPEPQQAEGPKLLPLDIEIRDYANAYGTAFTPKTLTTAINASLNDAKHERGRVKLTLDKLYKAGVLVKHTEETPQGPRHWYQPANLKTPITTNVAARVAEMQRQRDPDLNPQNFTKSPESAAVAMAGAVKRPKNPTTPKVRR